MSRHANDGEGPDRHYIVTGGRSRADENTLHLVTLIVSECDPVPGMQSEHVKRQARSGSGFCGTSCSSERSVRSSSWTRAGYPTRGTPSTVLSTVLTALVNYLYALSSAQETTPMTQVRFQNNPAQLYRDIRRQHGPVAPVLLEGDVPAWLVLGYRELLEVTGDSRLFARDSRRWNAWYRVPADWPAHADPWSSSRPRCSPRGPSTDDGPTW